MLNSVVEVDSGSQGWEGSESKEVAIGLVGADTGSSSPTPSLPQPSPLVPSANAHVPACAAAPVALHVPVE